MDKSVFGKLIRFFSVPVYIKDKNHIYTYWNSGITKFKFRSNSIFPSLIKRVEKYLFQTMQLAKHLLRYAGQLLNKWGRKNRSLVITSTGSRSLSLCEIQIVYNNTASKTRGA